MIYRACTSFLILLALVSAGLAKDPPPTDAHLTDLVSMRLANDPDVKGGALKVEVKEGVATLAGVVETNKQKEKATKLAKKVKGVTKVVNNITLRDQAPTR